METRPETVFSKKFTKAFIAGERSDVSIHKALIEGLVEFHRKDNNTVGLAWAVRFMQARNPESARFRAIVEWLEAVAQFKVTIDENNVKGTNVTTKRKVEYDKDWLEGCKARPWYKVARDMQKAKPWNNPLESMERQYATGYLMGDISRDEMLQVFAPLVVDQIIRNAITDDKIQDKVIERMSKLDEQGQLAA